MDIVAERTARWLASELTSDRRVRPKRGEGAPVGVRVEGRVKALRRKRLVHKEWYSKTQRQRPAKAIPRKVTHVEMRGASVGSSEPSAFASHTTPAVAPKTTAQMTSAAVAPGNTAATRNAPTRARTSAAMSRQRRTAASISNGSTCALASEMPGGW
jgi:hypothetical protein